VSDLRYDASKLRLRVNGVEYGDILSATWTRGIEQVVHSASLTVSEKWMQPTKIRAFPFRKFAPCEFVVDDVVSAVAVIVASAEGEPVGSEYKRTV
jgi:hypothetical protein